MIESFRDKETKKIFDGEGSRKLPTSIHRSAQRKLSMLHAAVKLQDLKVPPGNRLEKLSKDREGQYSIRINSQWRICFFWSSGHPTDVEITDYH